MRFSSPLSRGRLIKRYKRFLADVALDGGETLTALCSNTGSMLGLCEPGTPVWLSTSANAGRKYARTLEMVETDLGSGPRLVGVNTSLPNAIVAEAIAEGRASELAGYGALTREVRYGDASRIDILLSDPVLGRAYVEIKNVHMMRRDGLAEFPDCATARGAKHLRELAAMAKAGHRAVILFLIQREDAEAFTAAADIDPAYAEALDGARAAGVEALAYRCRMSRDEIVLGRTVPIEARRSNVTRRRHPA